MITDVIPILMITWNRLSYTKQAIKAILKNTKYPFILWIWDNNSTDGTVDYINNISDNRIQVIFSPENVGLIPPMNEFFKWHKDFEYIAKVDNDTIVPKDWLIKLKKVMDKFPLFTVQADHYLGIPFKLRNNQEFYDQLEKVESEEGNLYLFPHVGGSGILIRRKYIDKPMEKKGLSGWVDFQRLKSITEKLCCAFYDGIFINLLDMIGTNKIKNDYPDYRKRINIMRSGKKHNTGFGIMDLNIGHLKGYKEMMRKNWNNEN